MQHDHQHGRQPAAAPHIERREQQQRQRPFDRERRPRHRAHHAGGHGVTQPDRERRRQPVEVDRVMNRAPLPPARPPLVDGVEEVDERELADQRHHRERGEGLRAGAGIGRFARRERVPALAAGEHRVDGPATAGGQERGPDAEQAEDHVAAVVEQQQAAVQAQDSDQARDLGEARAEADQQREVGNRADDEPRDRLVPVRGQVEQRDGFFERWPPEQRVIRNQSFHL